MDHKKLVKVTIQLYSASFSHPQGEHGPQEVSQDNHSITFSIIQPSTTHFHSYCETYSAVHFSLPTDIHPEDDYGGMWRNE